MDYQDRNVLNVTGSTGTGQDFKVRSFDSLDFKMILFRQIVIIQNKMLEGDVIGFTNSVNLMEALLSGYMDEEYIKKIKKIKNKYEKERLINQRNSHENGWNASIQFKEAYEKFKELMGLLGRRNLLPLPAFAGRVVPNYYHKIDKYYEEEYSITSEKLKEIDEKINEIKKEILEESMEEYEEIEGEEDSEDDVEELDEDKLLSNLRGDLDG